MSEKIDINSIENQEQLKEAYDKLVEQYEEVIKNAGPIAKKAIELGYKKQIEKINKKYEEIKQSIDATKKDIGDIGEQGKLSEMGVARDAASKKQDARQWQTAYEGRSAAVTGAVDAVQKGATSAKAMVAIGAIRLTTFGAKGARLFGAKGTAQKIAESGDKYAQALFTKDSRIGGFAEKMAESGFMKADDVRKTIAHSKETLEAYGRAGIQMGKDAVKAGREGVKKVVEKGKDATKSVKDYVKNTKEDIGNIREQGKLSEMGVARDAASKKQDARQWQTAYEGRSAAVTGAVDAVQKGATSAKAMVAIGAIKLTTFGAKGVRLFGAKETAQKIAESGDKYAQALFTKDSRIGGFAEKMAESGFMKADDVRDTIDHSKEMLGAYGRAAIQTGKEAKENVVETAKHVKKETVRVTKEGALAVGKAALIPAAAIGAVGSFSLKVAKKGVKAVGEKASEIGEDVGEFKELATAKTVSVKNDMKVGFFSKVSRFLDNVKGNVDKSLVNSKEAQQQSNERYAAAKQKFNPQKEAQGKDEQEDDGR